MKALAFDLYGTLVDLGGLEAAVAKVMKKPKEFVATWRAKQMEYTFLLGLMGRYLSFGDVTARALAATCARLGVDAGAKARESLMQRWRELPAFPDVAPALKALQPRIPLAVLSNAETAMAVETLKHAGLESFFTQVLSADEVRTFKPNPRVYRLAAMRLHLDPKDIFLVSANSFDVMGAKAAGLGALWVNRAKEEFESLDLRPDAELRDFSTLTDHV